jgi:hypothetical protein
MQPHDALTARAIDAEPYVRDGRWVFPAGYSNVDPVDGSYREHIYRRDVYVPPLRLLAPQRARRANCGRRRRPGARRTRAPSRAGPGDDSGPASEPPGERHGRLAVSRGGAS